MFSLFSKAEGIRGNGLWKQNNYLYKKSTCINSMKKLIISTLENLRNENITDEQSVWEYSKYKIRKFSKIALKTLLVLRKLNLYL